MFPCSGSVGVQETKPKQSNTTKAIKTNRTTGDPFLLKDVSGIRAIDRKNEDGQDKSSINMFKEWMGINVRANFDMDAVIIAPLKKIRKIRQVPAHELYSNEYDVDIYEKQKDLVDESYEALRAIRSLFMGHPLAKSVKIPSYLLSGKNIVFY